MTITMRNPALRSAMDMHALVKTCAILPVCLAGYGWNRALLHTREVLHVWKRCCQSTSMRGSTLL